MSRCSTSASGIFPVAHCSTALDVILLQYFNGHQYVRFEPFLENPRYLNAETFQEEILEHPGDRFQDPNNLDLKKICLGSGYIAGEKGPCFWCYHRTLTSSVSLRGEIGHISSVGMGASSSSTHRVWKHTWRFATYTSSPRLVVLFFSFVTTCRHPERRC